MEIVVKNCNNIVEGRIDIAPRKLNIKYGINGTGKSSISDAIYYGIKGESLEKLKPFGSGDNIVSTVEGIDTFSTIKIYNDNYVSQYLFLQNGENLHQNSFEVFIKPNNYEQGIENINSMLGSVKTYVIENDIINTLINQKNQLAKILKLNTNRNSINSTGVGKALNVGNKIVNIPIELENYSSFISGNEKVKWYNWQLEGRENYIQNGKCPFCTTTLATNFTSLMETLDNIFDKNNVEALVKMDNIVTPIEQSLSEDTNQLIRNILNNEEPIDNDTKSRLASFIVELEKICDRLQFFMYIDYSTLKNIDDLQQQLINSKIVIEDLQFVKGDDFLNVVNEINGKIDEMIDHIQELRVAIGELNTSIRDTTNRNKRRINDFLETVGMQYEVNVIDNKLLLLYKGSEIIVDVNSHLSWGEKNAFALSLFLFDCLYDNPDLIILDDPVSSFDFNKKFAITHYLFNQTNCLKDKTVLMLTHDLEPIIDMLKVREYPFVQCFYITNENGTVTENVILERDVTSIIDVTKNCFTNLNLKIINRLIHFRRYLELNNEYDFEYNMISSLLKGKQIPRYKNNMNRIDRDFTQEEFNNTQSKIQSFINEFDYNTIWNTISCRSDMKQLYLDSDNNYEKIEIFRIMLKTFGLLNVNPVIEQFINEAFHIENTYIFQLDPYAYNLVPSYIVDMCTTIINRMPVGIPTP